MAYIDDIVETILATDRAKRPHEAIWQRNVSLFKGYQWERWHPLFGLSPGVKEDSWRVRQTFNYFRAMALTLAAKATQNRPTWAAFPATDDDDDMEKSRACTGLLDHTWRKQYCAPKLHKTALWTILTGQGYWGTYWNARAGDYLGKDKAGKMQYSGFPQIDDVSPFDIGVDPMAANIHESEWGYRVRLVSVEWAKEVLNEKVAGEDMGSGYSESEIWSRMQSASLLTDAKGNLVKTNYVRVVEWFDTRKQTYVIFLPNGRKILKQGDWAYPVPYKQCRFIPNMGDIEADGSIASHQSMGDTSMSDVAGLQQELNRRESRLTEIANLLGAPRIIAREGSIIEETLTNAPASVVLYKGKGMPPQPFHLGNISPWIYSHPDRIIDRMRDITGIHEIISGTNATGVYSGKHAGLLAEQDATRFYPLAVSISDMLGQAAEAVLQYWSDYGQEEALIQVMGQNGTLEVVNFMRNSIRSTDVWVQPGSTFASSKMLQRDQIKELYTLGMIPDANRALRAMEYGDLDSIFGDRNVHSQKQRRELGALLRDGTPMPQPQPWEDAEAHLEVTTEFLNGTTFEMQPVQVQQNVIEHWKAHMETYQQQMDVEQGAARERGIAASGGYQQASAMRDQMGGSQSPNARTTLQGSEGSPASRPDRAEEAFSSMGGGRMMSGGLQ